MIRQACRVGVLGLAFWAAASAGPAEAQFVGHPRWGWGYDHGAPFGGVGFTLDDVNAARRQQYALNVSRYEAETARAAQAYQAAHYYRQQAIATALENAKRGAELRRMYGTTTVRKPAPAKPTAPLDSLIGRAGRVSWPAVAPVNDARVAVDEAIRAVAREHRQRGRAGAARVIEAHDKLRAYGRPALARVRRQRPTAGEPFKDFLNDLDASLDVMASPPATPDEHGPAESPELAGRR